MMNAPLPPPVDMIRRLIATPSVSSTQPELDTSNRPVLELLANWLEPLGFAVRLEPLPEDPAKANLIAVLGRGEGGLVLAGHADTVPYDSQGWRFDPFAGVVEDERIFGLGSADMKSFLALAATAAASFRADQLRRPLVLVATADEETSMAGARALAAASAPLGRYAIIGEPTGLRPVRMHKGILMERLRIFGRSGHSSNPALGSNAMEGMHRVIAALLALRAQWQATHRDTAFAVPGPTLNLGHIRGGDNPNRICAQCELHFDLRPLPGMAPDTLRERLQQEIATALEGSELRFELTPLTPPVPPAATAAGSRIVQVTEALTGAPAEAVSFATEAPFFNALGLDSIVLGPGDIAVAHQPDEHLPLDTLAPTVALLHQAIHRCCIDDAD